MSEEKSVFANMTNEECEDLLSGHTISLSKKIDVLRNANNELKLALKIHEQGYYKDQAEIFKNELEKLESRHKKLLDALEYYADKKRWGESGIDQRGWYVIESTDRGTKAREAIEADRKASICTQERHDNKMCLDNHDIATDEKASGE